MKERQQEAKEERRRAGKSPTYRLTEPFGTTCNRTTQTWEWTEKAAIVAEVFRLVDEEGERTPKAREALRVNRTDDPHLASQSHLHRLESVGAEARRKKSEPLRQDLLRQTLTNASTLTAIIEASMNRTADVVCQFLLPAIDGQGLKRREKRLLDAYEAGEIELDELRRRREEIRKTIAAAERAASSITRKENSWWGGGYPRRRGADGAAGGQTACNPRQRLSTAE